MRLNEKAYNFYTKFKLLHDEWNAQTFDSTSSSSTADAYVWIVLTNSMRYILLRTTTNWWNHSEHHFNWHFYHCTLCAIFFCHFFGNRFVLHLFQLRVCGTHIRCGSQFIRNIHALSFEWHGNDKLLHFRKRKSFYWFLRSVEEQQDCGYKSCVLCFGWRDPAKQTQNLKLTVAAHLHPSTVMRGCGSRWSAQCTTLIPNRLHHTQIHMKQKQKMRTEWIMR